MRRLLALTMCAVSLGATAQLFSKQASSFMDIPDGYCVSTEIVATHEDGVLSGMTTYRLYLQCENEQDYLSAIGGVGEPESTDPFVEGGPLVLNASSGTWYNSGCNFEPTAAGVVPALVEYVPTLAYDSWITIGAASNIEIPANDISSAWGDINPEPQFEAPYAPPIESFDDCIDFEGMNVTVDDPIGGSWYVPFPGSYDEDNTAFAHEDLRILIMQITTSGEFTGQAFFQIFMNADQNQETRGVLDFSSCVSPGCTDESACNYDIGALQDDGSCDYSCCPGPGCCHEGTIWDSNLQQCIVANPADINLDGCVQLNDLLDLLSAYGDCGVEESPWLCGDPLEYQGYNYATVQIGEQCWFAENLRAENYRNGEAIPSNLDNNVWDDTSLGATAIYGEGTGPCDEASYGPVCLEQWSLEEFGRLYNGYAVKSDGLLCPVGWHVPTDNDWISLEISLGMDEAVAHDMNWRGSNEGAMLKAQFSWNEGGNGQDDFGFTALAAGVRTDNTGHFNYAGANGSFWTSTCTSATCLTRQLSSSNSSVRRVNQALKNGFSIRCIKDAE